MKSIIISVAALALAAAPALAQFGPQAGGTVNANLYGRQFGSANGSATGFGNANISFDRNNQARLQATANGIGTINHVGIYRDGALVASFGGDNFDDVDDWDDIDLRQGSIDTRITLNQQLIDAIRANPGAYSLRIDSDEFPGGAVTGNFFGNRFFGVTLTPDQVPSGAGAPGAFGNVGFSIRNDAAAGAGNVFLDYDFIANEIGDNADAIYIRNRGTGETVFTLGTNRVLVEGRNSGTVAIPEHVVTQLLANPSQFEVVANTAAYPQGAVGGQLGFTNEIFIPVIGSIQGVGGSRWNSDLRIFNSSSQTAVVLAQFYPRGGANANVPERSTTFVIPANGSAEIDDTMNGLFNEFQGIGALRLSSNASITAQGRIFNDQRQAGLGTFGQMMPGVSRNSALHRGVIAGFTDDDTANARFAARSNFGFFNPWDTATMVEVTLRASDGTILDSRTIMLEAWQQSQMPLRGNTGLFPGLTGNTSDATVTFRATAPILAYGSVIDNVSGDPSTLLPQSWDEPMLDGQM